MLGHMPMLNVRVKLISIISFKIVIRVPFRAAFVMQRVLHRLTASVWL